MKRFKILICILTLILIILICALLFIPKKSKDMEIVSEALSKYDDLKINREDYFIVCTVCRQYLDNLNTNNSKYYRMDENNNYIKTSTDEEIKSYIINLLSIDYIEKNGITVKNLYDKVNVLNDNYLFVPLEIELIRDSDVREYYAKGLLLDSSDNNSGMELNAIVYIDRKNNTFSIEPTVNSKNIQPANINEIKPNDNNEIIGIGNLDNETIIRDYLNNIKRLMVNSPEWTYEHILNNKFKEEFFGNEENFKKYVEENKDRIMSTRLNEYASNLKENYIEYIIVDQNNNYYYINERNIMDYDLIIGVYDMYTNSFNNKYDETNDQGKTALNIDKFIKALNNKLYYYIYNSMLSEEFKNNYFKTLEDFEKYAKENFYNTNKVNYIDGSYVKDLGLNKYTLKLTNSDNENETITKTFVVKLNENRDFKMSFNVK